MIVLGIDPGLTGALAIFDTKTRQILKIEDMPTYLYHKAHFINHEALAALLHALVPMEIYEGQVFAVLEQVSSSPKMGNASAFKFGGAYFSALQACVSHGIPTITIPAAMWMHAMGLPSKKQAPEASRMKAISLFPNSIHYWEREKDHGRSDAALLAIYGAELSRRYKGITNLVLEFGQNKARRSLLR